MKCEYCGRNYDDINNSCPYCGAANTGDSSQNSYNQNGYDYSQDGQKNNFNFGTPQQNWNNTYGGGFGVNIRKRNILVSVILSIITCNIYSIFWFISLVDDLNYASGRQNEPSGATVFIFSIISCGIYFFYWLYKAGDKVNEMKRRNGMTADASNGIIYFLCGFLGCGIIAYCLLQSELNRVAL